MKRVIILPLTLALALLVLFQVPTAQMAHATSIFSPTYSDASAVFFNSTVTGLTDQTTAASNPNPSDVQLGGNTNDAHIVGAIAAPFTSIVYNVTSGGDVSGIVQWQYWNGTLWKQFPTVVDSTKNFTKFPGIFFVNFTSPSSNTLPSDWRKTTIPTPTKKVSGTLAFYARARTMSSYAIDAVPRTAQLSILVLPVSKVEVTVNLWNGTGVPDANVSLWAMGELGPRWTLTASVTGGTYDFTAAQHRLANGQQFLIRVAKFGYQNLTAPAIGFFTYDSTLSVNFEGLRTLHGSLQVRAFKAFPPSTLIPSVTGTVTNKTSSFSMTGVANATGVVEFPVDWRSSGLVNVTISKPGWITTLSKNVTLTSWTTTSLTVRLQTTIRVNAVTELGFPIPGANITVRDLSQTVLLATFDGSALDQDGNSTDGIAYLAFDPASVATPISITVSRPGLSNFAMSSLAVNSTKQLVMTSANRYGIKVDAWDELNNPLALAKADTGFAGLSNVQADFSGGTAYLAADPASPGFLTIAKSGYVNTATATVVRPPSPGVFSIQTVTYKATSGTGPGLPFAVKVVGVYNELDAKFQIGTNATLTSTSGAFVINSENGYLAATGTVNVTASSPGYVDETALNIMPTAVSQTTIIFKAGGTAAGLPYTVKVIGIANQFGETLASATVFVPGVSPIQKGTVFYLAIAPSNSVNLVASALGYVNASISVTPLSTSQSTVTFGVTGSTATVKGSGLFFTLKVNVVQSWDSLAVQGATVGVYSDPAFASLITSATTDSSGNVYLALSPTGVYVQVSLSTYATYKGPALQLSSAQQTISSVSFTAKTSTLSASGTTISVTANTNISGLDFNSTSNTISLTSTSPSAGYVNVTIPQSLIPAGATIKVTSGGQTVTYTTTQDANNVYLRIPTTSGTNALQVAFPAPSSPASPSLLITIVIIAVVIAALGVVAYVVLRRRKPTIQPKAT